MTVTNADRAHWAEVAVEAFQEVCPTDDCDAIKDLIVDLCHLERRRRAERGIEDFNAYHYLAMRADMYDQELEEDEEE